MKSNKVILKVVFGFVGLLVIYIIAGIIINNRKYKYDDAIAKRIELEGTGFVFRDALNKIFPHSDYVTVFGKELTPYLLNNKIKVINFWFTKCKPCIIEMPELNELTREYNSDVIFIAFTPDEKKTVLEFLAETPFDYQIVSDSRNLIKSLLIAEVYPAHLVVDKQGNILYANSGFRYNDVRYVLDSLTKRN